METASSLATRAPLSLFNDVGAIVRRLEAAWVAAECRDPPDHLRRKH